MNIVWTASKLETFEYGIRRRLRRYGDYIFLKAATFSFKEFINVIPNVGIDLLLYKKDYIVKKIAMELMQKYWIGSIIPFYNKLLLIDAFANITCTFNNIIKIVIASNEAIEKYCTCK